MGIPIDMLDIGCPKCGATYTAGEPHACFLICGLCDKPAVDGLERPGGLIVCLACRQAERARYEAATGRCARGCDYELAFHTSRDRCPTEDEARRMSGTA